MSPLKGGRPENFLPQGARCWEQTGALSGDTGTAGVSWDVLGGWDAWALAPGGSGDVREALRPGRESKQQEGPGVSRWPDTGGGAPSLQARRFQGTRVPLLRAGEKWRRWLQHLQKVATAVARAPLLFRVHFLGCCNTDFSFRPGWLPEDTLLSPSPPAPFAVSPPPGAWRRLLRPGSEGGVIPGAFLAEEAGKGMACRGQPQAHVRQVVPTGGAGGPCHVHPRVVPRGTAGVFALHLLPKGCRPGERC